MRLFATLLLGFAFAPQVLAQSSAASAMEARQAEVVQLGQQIYRINLGEPGWTHQLVPVCPAFKHHVFARYQRSVGGKQTAYLAVFPLDVAGPPPETKPWRGGIILLNLDPKDKEKPVAEQQNTITIFNHVWSYEFAHSGRPNTFPELDWSGLAECYARFANEVPKSTEPHNPAENPIDPKTLPVSNLLLPIVTTGKHARFINVSFEPTGMLREAQISESPLEDESR